MSKRADGRPKDQTGPERLGWPGIELIERNRTDPPPRGWVLEKKRDATMAARVNTKFVILLCGVLVLMVAGAGAGYWFLVHKTADQLEAEGDAYANRAEINLEKVAELEGDAAYEMYEKSGTQFKVAYESYKRALADDRTNLDLLDKFCHQFCKNIP